MPLWHSVFFRNVHQHTYYNTALIAQGVLTWGDLMVEENAQMIRAFPATWRPVYLRGKSLVTSIRPGPFDQPTQWYLLWGKGFSSQFSAPDLSYLGRQSPEVWGVLPEPCAHRARTVRAPCVLLRILCPPDPQCLNLSCPGLSPDCLCTTTAPTGIGCRLCMVCYGGACKVQKLGAWNL